MAHIHREPVEGRLLYDGCPECEARAKSIRGLHHLDPSRINTLWDKMQALEFSDGPSALLADEMSAAEVRACQTLYDIGVLLEHMTESNMKFARPALRFDAALAERTDDG